MVLLLVCFAAVSLAGTDMTKQDEKEASISLIVATPEEGFQLAIALARKGVTETQPDKEVLKKLRPAYAHDPDSLIAASQVVAIHFQTIAAANNYWRDEH
ncbi:MAG: hexameric tyrosine-coordinated heme protein [Bacteroidales bacterium]